MSRIDEKTLFPLSLIILIMGGVMWLTSMSSKVNANEKQLEDLNSTHPGSLRHEVKEIQKSLSRIEGALHIKRENAKD